MSLLAHCYQVSRRPTCTALRLQRRKPLLAQAITSRPSFSTDSQKKEQGRHRLGRTLYRQLLQWCQTTGDEVPLTRVVPPVTLQPPHVHADALLRCSEISAEMEHKDDDDQWMYVKSLLPPNSQVDSQKMIVPIHRASDVKNLFRAVYRMNLYASRENDRTPSVEETKRQTTVAFEALKSLNQLTEGINHMITQREAHMDRTGVLYRLGQVVQHKTERWRGVITGWHRQTEAPQQQQSDRKTSLTQKSYIIKGNDLLKENDEDKPEVGDFIQYDVVLDSGDAHLLAGRRQFHDQTGMPKAMQSDLEPVTDESLIRIRSNWTEHNFDRFDALHKCFIPNETQSYEYPLDDIHGEENTNDSIRRNELGKQVVDGVQAFADRLNQTIAKGALAEYPLVAAFQKRLEALSRGDVASTRDELYNSTEESSSADLGVLHLRNLLNIGLELSELVWARRIAEEHKERIKFSLGDIVHHKKYDFRGVVVAWDPKPVVDVSRWDGLEHIENAEELPFYHVIPDQNDCVAAFGGERPFRYVCEANLEACPRHRTILEVDLDPEWEMNQIEARYMPPEELKFKYAQGEEEDFIIAACFSSILAEVARLHLAMRTQDPLQHEELEFISIAEKLSLDTLFELLQLSNSMESAMVFEETIKEVWKAHNDVKLRERLDHGIADLLRGNKERALTTFQAIVKDDPTYAEAWNKISTCQFMLGNMQSSLEAADKALELEPRHFQARNGLGLIQYETRRYRMAVKSFRQSLSIDPWSPVSSRLAACLDLLDGLDDVEAASSEGEEGAEEGTAPYEGKSKE